MGKFIARAIGEKTDLDEIGVPHVEGWVMGWYSDGFMLGDVINTDDEYITHEWWCKVDKSTLKEAE